MVTHMKTTLDISDHIFRRTKKLADREGKTFRTVVEEALVVRLDAREQAAQPNILHIPTVSGEITPEFAHAPWEQIRDELYAYPSPAHRAASLSPLALAAEPTAAYVASHVASPVSPRTKKRKPA